MRIVYIVQHFPGPNATGGGARPYEHSRRLVARGHQVDLLCGDMADWSSSEDIDGARATGVRVHRAAIRYEQGMSAPARLVAFHRYLRWAAKRGCALGRPDVVLASSTPLTVGEIGRRVARHHQVPLVFEVRDLWPEVPMAMGALKNPVLRCLAHRMAKRVYQAASHVIALSPGMKDAIAAWGVPPGAITVVSNCSDITLFGDTSLRASERHRLGWEGNLVCLHPGALGRANGIDYLLDAAKVLDERGTTDVHLALVGKGAEEARLRKRIAAEGIRSAAVYEARPRKDMPAVFAAADAGVVTFQPLPYLDTNSANKFFDFLAAGLPVLINYGGWQDEVLRRAGAGLSVDPHRPSALADALLALRDDEAGRRQMGERAQRLAEEHYDRELLFDRLERTLSSVAGRGYGERVCL